MTRLPLLPASLALLVLLLVSFDSFTQSFKHLSLPKVNAPTSFRKLQSLPFKFKLTDAAIPDDLPILESSIESPPMVKHHLPSMLLLPSAVIASTVVLLPGVVHAADDIATISIVKPAIDFFINTMSFLFLGRTILSWYPKTNLKEFPYNVIVWPTEALAQPVRELIPPAFGVDISPIIWIMVLSFLREILTGQQGILTLLERS